MSFDKTNYLENDTAVEADFTATPTNGAGLPINKGDVALVVKVARWYVVIGELEAV